MRELLRKTEGKLIELIEEKDVLERQIHEFINYRNNNPINLNEQMKTLQEIIGPLVNEKLEVEKKIEKVQSQIQIIEMQIQINGKEKY